MQPCVRCGKQTNVTIVSMFNTDEICMECKDAEREHPDYQSAVAADEAAIRSGDFNFKGIGTPATPWPGVHPNQKRFDDGK